MWCSSDVRCCIDFEFSSSLSKGKKTSQLRLWLIHKLIWILLSRNYIIRSCVASISDNLHFFWIYSEPNTQLYIKPKLLPLCKNKLNIARHNRMFNVILRKQHSVHANKQKPIFIQILRYSLGLSLTLCMHNIINILTQFKSFLRIFQT